MNKTTKILTALLLATSSNCVFAQDQDKPDRIVLEQKLGSVMTSTGGDYESANVGKLLVRNESMMLSDGAKATVVFYYDDDKRKCTEKYEGPNTVIIDDNCTKAAYVAGHNGAAVGVIVGAAVLGAVILNSMDKVPPGPISGGAR